MINSELGYEIPSEISRCLSDSFHQSLCYHDPLFLHSYSALSLILLPTALLRLSAHRPFASSMCPPIISTHSPAPQLSPRSHPHTSRPPTLQSPASSLSPARSANEGKSMPFQHSFTRSNANQSYLHVRGARSKILRRDTDGDGARVAWLKWLGEGETRSRLSG